MYKRWLLTGIAVIFILLSAACGNVSEQSDSSQVTVQNIMLDNDAASDEPDIMMPSDPMQSDGPQADALAEEKDYLQNQIDALNEKIENLKWLRDSYIQQNPADLEAKLLECDALIADAQTELQNLQDRIARNEQDQNALNGDEPAAEHEDIVPEEPLEPPVDSSEPTPEESAPAS